MYGQKDANGKVINKSNFQFEGMGELPEGSNVGDFVKDGKAHIPPNSYSLLLDVKNGIPVWADDIEAAKREKLAEISSAYTSECTTRNQGISSATLGAEIDCRESDVLKISNLVTLLTATGVSEHFYKCRDNTKIPCTVDQIKAVLTELIAAQVSMWTVKQALSKAVEDATTSAEIQEITWRWPA